LIYFGAAILFILIAGATYQAVSLILDRRRFPPPGTLVEAGGTKLHVYCTGKGHPAVLLEAGISASSVSWSRVQTAISSFIRVCSYDRAGLAWSARCPCARTPDQILTELRAVADGLPKPFVFVGHSFGAWIGSMYASRFPADICGLILVDPPLISEWANPSRARLRMLARGVRLSRRGAGLCRIGFVRFSLALLAGGARTLPKLIAKASSGKGAHTLDRLVSEVRKIPEELWPAIRSHWSRPECFESMAAHLEGLPAMAAAMANIQSLGSLPLIVISGSQLAPEQRSEHMSLAQLSTRGKHVEATQGGHWVNLDQPELVVELIRELVSDTQKELNLH
jgi:pimeloyl-ACP methyl ester carboxylesterase